MKYGLSEDTLSKIQAVFLKQPKIEKAILYGSRAKGTHHEGSDIDLTLVGESLELTDLYTVDEALDELNLPYTIDLSLYGQINNEGLIGHIERRGVEFYNNTVITEWSFLPFEKCIQKTKYSKKIKKKKFLGYGKYPIISQESDFINGYWNIDEDVFRVKSPVVIFGDHTKVVKHIDFDFVLGADGVKILKPIEELDSKFFSYFLENNPIDDLGYSRHYRLLKKVSVPIPTIYEQKRIVTILDQAFAEIEKARSNAEQNLKNAREFYLSKKNEVFQNLQVVSVLMSLPSVCDEMFAGGDAPKKGLFSKHKTEQYQVPIFANAVKNNGLYGFTDSARANKPSITIAARGSGTGHIELRREPFLPIVRLIVLIPNLDKLILEYFKYALQSLDILRSGSAIPQLTVPMIKEYLIPVPSLERQKNIIEELDNLDLYVKQVQKIYEKKILLLEDLKKSILQKAFSGELTQEATT